MEEHAPGDTADAVRACAEKLQKDFVVIGCDCLTSVSMRTILDRYKCVGAGRVRGGGRVLPSQFLFIALCDLPTEGTHRTLAGIGGLRFSNLTLHSGQKWGYFCHATVRVGVSPLTTGEVHMQLQAMKISRIIISGACTIMQTFYDFPEFSTSL